MNSPLLAAPLSQAQASAARALADIGALVSAAEQSQENILAALRQAERAAALVQVFDETALRDFLAKPYLARPRCDGQYELIVPRFVGLQAGWPVRHDGANSVFLVSKFTLAASDDRAPRVARGKRIGEMTFAANRVKLALDK